MNRTVKTFLLWLLMAVLPLHAAAASIGMSCAPVHGKAAQHEMAQDDHAHHGAAHADSMAGHAAGHAAHDGGTPDADAPQPHSTCSACSALCIGAVAPPSARLSLPNANGSEAVAVAPPRLVTGFIPEGPQRPPRRHFA